MAQAVYFDVAAVVAVAVVAAAVVALDVSVAVSGIVIVIVDTVVKFGEGGYTGLESQQGQTQETGFFEWHL